MKLCRKLKDHLHKGKGLRLVTVLFNNLLWFKTNLVMKQTKIKLSLSIFTRKGSPSFLKSNATVPANKSYKIS